MNVAIIPARKGSQQVPGKNYLPVAGKPLVCWSIEAALACPLVDLVVVSSNCGEVERVVDPYRQLSQVLFLERPEDISGPHAATEKALIHVCDELWMYRGIKTDWVTLLQPTSPVRNHGLLTKCCESIIGNASGCHDSLMTCSVHTPFFYRLGTNNLAFAVDHDACNRPMRQSLKASDKLYHDCGNVYITHTDLLRETDCRVGRFPYLFPVSDYQAKQIDTLEDLAMLEVMNGIFGSFI
jgi:CMP-N-acetylneuraminic acid synthetase